MMFMCIYETILKWIAKLKKLFLKRAKKELILFFLQTKIIYSELEGGRGEDVIGSFHGNHYL